MFGVVLTVTGSRGITDEKFIFNSLDDFLVRHNLPPTFVTLNSGHAIGVDRIAESWAKTRNIPTKLFIPDWSKGKSAGMIRNKIMVDNATYVVGIWDKSSRGTKHCLDYAVKQGKIVDIYEYE